MYSFPLEDNEQILKKGMANYDCDGVLLHGALYLTADRLVFVGYELSLTNKYMAETPLEHIKDVRPAETFLIIPNVIVINTINDRIIKYLVNGRDEWIFAINQQMNLFS